VKKYNIKGREVKRFSRIGKKREIMDMILAKAKRFKRSGAKGT